MCTSAAQYNTNKAHFRTRRYDASWTTNKLRWRVPSTRWERCRKETTAKRLISGTLQRQVNHTFFVRKKTLYATFNINRPSSRTLSCIYFRTVNLWTVNVFRSPSHCTHKCLMWITRRACCHCVYAYPARDVARCMMSERRRFAASACSENWKAARWCWKTIRPR